MENARKTIEKHGALKSWSDTVFSDGSESQKHFIDAMKGIVGDKEYMVNIKHISDELSLKARKEATVDHAIVEPKVEVNAAEQISEEKAQEEKTSNLFNKIKVRREAVQAMRKEGGN